jgi:hypothetical protein
MTCVGYAIDPQAVPPLLFLCTHLGVLMHARALPLFRAPYQTPTHGVQMDVLNPLQVSLHRSQRVIEKKPQTLESRSALLVSGRGVAVVVVIERLEGRKGPISDLRQVRRWRAPASFEPERVAQTLVFQRVCGFSFKLAPLYPLATVHGQEQECDSR